MTERLSTGLALLSPAAVVAYLAFDAGGYFAGATAIGATVLIVALALRVLIAAHPLAGVSVRLVVASGALAALAAWALLSHVWSDSPARALLEFDRTLLYLTAVVLVALVPRSRGRVQVLVWAMLAAIALVVGAAVLTRILPEVFPTDPAMAPERLSYPITYWNGLGILAGFGVILALAVASDVRQPALARPLAGALVAPMAVGVYFTFSRGAILATLIGLVVFCVAARPRGLLTAVPAVAPATAIALIVSYQADALASAEFASAQGVDEGRTVAVVLLLATIGAGLAMAIGLRFDRRLAELHLPARLRRPALATGAGAALAAVVIAITVGNAPARISQQVDRFMEGTVTTGPEDARGRLTEFGNNRRDHWSVATTAWRERPIAGRGAGTFALLWAQERPDDTRVEDAHSLYLETLAELGIVGFLLLLTALLALLYGAARRLGGPNRVLHGGILAVLSAWALHAGLDWDWELPAVTIVPLALGAAALAGRRPRLPAPGRLPRIGIAIGLLVLALTPISIARSQSRLDAGVEALRAGNCPEAIDSALGSIDALSARPEPFELLAYCNARLGEADLAERAAGEAIRRDPDNWQLHYVLAVVRAATGRDPRAPIARARELSPLDPRVIDLHDQLHTDDPGRWRAAGRSAPLLLP